ncbi:hypothetical protein Cs7R123_54090 [Catellatospora sp. TT07R-123]|uniref:hypothetical protein n=1 Tax=Catellatospora sp. TT07R-123 TaxID=2733863 RepID=UPI001B29DD3E|nr:hypothetical protein [Catellatospora sp. TT07R-123]GHJ48067.1 hypothetical protein Cs7R123_54090 [Catellatospora sp. TT07R-123]
MKVLRGLGHLGRYTAGALASWAVFVAEGLLGYAALLLVALVRGGDLGGPLAGPLLVLLAAVLGGVVTAMVALPAVLVGEFVARRTGWLAAPVLAAAAAFALLGAGTWTVGLAADVPAPTVATAWLIVGLFTAAPFALLVAVVHGSGALLSRLTRRPARTAGVVRA